MISLDGLKRPLAGRLAPRVVFVVDALVFPFRRPMPARTQLVLVTYKIGHWLVPVEAPDFTDPPGFPCRAVGG